MSQFDCNSLPQESSHAINSPLLFIYFYLLDDTSHETAAPSRSETNAAPHLQKTSQLLASLLVSLAALFTL